MTKYIKTIAYSGIDRRRNNYMKIKDFITPTIIVTLLIGIMALGGYKFIIMATAEQVTVNTAKISNIEKDIIILKTKVPELQEDIKEVKQDIKEIQLDIKLVLRNLNRINDGN